jgi:hypothetical protein
MRRLVVRLHLALCVVGAPFFGGCGDSGMDPVPTQPAEQFRDPNDAQRMQVLDSLLEDILTNPKRAWIRDCYALPGSLDVGLAANGKIPWPKDYSPSVPGYSFHYLDPKRAIGEHEARMLGVSIRHFAFPPPPPLPAQAAMDDAYSGYPLAVAIFNIGGKADGYDPGAVDATLRMHYAIEKQEGKWVVRLGSASCP